MWLRRILMALMAALLLAACQSSTQQLRAFDGVRSAVLITDNTFAPAQTSSLTVYDGRNGSYAAVGDGTDSRYDAVSRTTTESAGVGAAILETNVSVSPPDRALQRDYVLADYVLSRLADAQRVEALGRPAFQLQFPVDPVLFEYDQATVVIDEETGLLMFLRASLGDRPIRDWQRTTFELNPQISFDLVMNTAGMDVQRTDDGFVETQLDLVKEQVGYEPVTTRVPSGYELNRVLTKRTTSEPTGLMGSNPRSEKIVVLEYISGWRRLVFTSRSSIDPSAKWTDPFVVSEGEGAGAVPLGPIAGLPTDVPGELVVVPALEPHTWAVRGDLVLTVSGQVDDRTLVQLMAALFQTA